MIAQLFILAAAAAIVDFADTVTRHVTLDSARILTPATYEVLTGRRLSYEIQPLCAVEYVDLHVTTYPWKTDTLGRFSKPPYRAEFMYDALPDHDQVHLQFGYTLYHANGDTIVSKPTPHRWVIDRKQYASRKHRVCKQLYPDRAIEIDGELGDWQGIAFSAVSDNATFACAWTPSHFFLAARVSDWTVCALDRVETRFDLRHTRRPLAGINHRFASFGPMRRSAAWAVALDSAGPRIADSIVIRLGDEIEWQSAHTADGYTIEVRIPFRVLSDLEFPPPEFGFDIAVVDAEGSDDPSPEVLTWSGCAPAERNMPSRWGTIALRQILLPLKITLTSAALLLFAVVALVLVLLARQKRHEAKERKEDARAFSPKLQIALGYIEEKATGCGLTLEQVAQKIGSDPKSLERLFNEEMGAPFRSALEQARVRFAKVHLRETEKDVGAIATSAGFTSIRAFEDAFARIVGTTPEDYRAGKQEDLAEEQEDEEA